VTPSLRRRPRRDHRDGAPSGRQRGGRRL